MQTRHAVLIQSAQSLESVADDSVELVVTSPPYPMIEMWDAAFAALVPAIGERLAAGRGPEAFEFMHAQLDAVWGECWRVVRPGGFVCINIGDATRSIGGGFRLFTNHARILSACEALGFQALPCILWRKPTNAPNKFMGSGMLPSGAYVTLEHEYVLVLRKGGKRVFAAADRQRRSRSAFFWEERNVWFSDVWDFRGTRQALPGSEARLRSAAFPFELAFRLINMYSLQEDTVLDPFSGTGTTMLAAIACARNSINVEIDARLAPVYDESIAAAAAGGAIAGGAAAGKASGGGASINARQLQRLADHNAFVERYERERGQQLGYRNRHYGFRVMTRQETELALPLVETIRGSGAGSYTALHAFKL